MATAHTRGAQVMAEHQALVRQPLHETRAGGLLELARERATAHRHAACQRVEVVPFADVREQPLQQVLQACIGTRRRQRLLDELRLATAPVRC